MVQVVTLELQVFEVKTDQPVYQDSTVRKVTKATPDSAVNQEIEVQSAQPVTTVKPVNLVKMVQQADQADNLTVKTVLQVKPVKQAQLVQLVLTVFQA